jgi:type VI secretion system protein VasG
MDVDSGARNADAILTRTLLAPISCDLLSRMASGKPVKKIAVSLKGEDIKVRLS